MARRADVIGTLSRRAGAGYVAVHWPVQRANFRIEDLAWVPGDRAARQAPFTRLTCTNGESGGNVSVGDISHHAGRRRPLRRQQPPWAAGPQTILNSTGARA
jgi:hypothetical protein